MNNPASNPILLALCFLLVAVVISFVFPLFSPAFALLAVYRGATWYPSRKQSYERAGTILLAGGLLLGALSYFILSGWVTEPGFSAVNAS